MDMDYTFDDILDAAVYRRELERSYDDWRHIHNMTVSYEWRDLDYQWAEC